MPAQEPSAQSWHDASAMQSAAAAHCPGGGGGVDGHVDTHAPLKQPGCAQLPSEHGRQTSAMAQSPAASHCEGGGGDGDFFEPQMNWQTPATQASAAQVSFAQRGQASTAGHSASD